MRNDARGVSVLSWATALSVHVLWTTYGFMENIPSGIVANVATGFGAMAVLLALHRQDTPALGQEFTILVICGSAAGAAYVAFGAVGVGTVAVVVGMAMFIPQAIAVYTNASTTGVSRVTWMLALAATLCWGWYGIGIGNVVVFLPTVVVAPVSVIILARAGREIPEESTVDPVVGVA